MGFQRLCTQAPWRGSGRPAPGTLLSKGWFPSGFNALPVDLSSEPTVCGSPRSRPLCCRNVGGTTVCRFGAKEEKRHHVRVHGAPGSPGGGNPFGPHHVRQWHAHGSPAGGAQTASPQAGVLPEDGLLSEPQAWTRCVGRTRRRVSDQRLFPRGRGHGRAGQRFREALTLRAAIALPCRNCGAGERAVRLTLAPALQTIYNAITHGTPCVVVEGSGRVADVIAQVASLPISEITVSLIQQKLAVFFQELFETFTEGRIVEWTKKVRPAARGPWARLTYGARSHVWGQEVDT